MTISTKISSSFLLLSFFVLICGLAGFYGIYKLSRSLDFVTTTAWDAADGAMEAVIGIQEQIIALERLISRIEVIHEMQEIPLKNLLKKGESMMKPALERAEQSGLMSQSELATLKQQVPDFLQQRNEVLKAHDEYHSAHLHLLEHHLVFRELMKSAEEFSYQVTTQFDNRLNALELKMMAIDGVTKVQMLLLERFYLYEKMTNFGSDQQTLVTLKETAIQLEQTVAKLAQHPYFKAAAKEHGGKTYQEIFGDLLQQHQQDFSETIETFITFKKIKESYFQTVNELLTYLMTFEEVGDSKVEGEMASIVTVKQSAYLIIIIVAVIAFVLAAMASMVLIRSITLPLQQVKSQLQTLALGKVVEEEINYQSRDEIANIIQSVSQLKASIRSTIEQANAIASGNCNNEIKLLSEEDELGHALAEMTDTLREVIQQAKAIAEGNYDQKIKLLSDQDQLGLALSEMTRRLREVTLENQQQDWLKTGLTQLNDQMSGEQDIKTLTHNVISFLPPYLEAPIGTLYLLDENLSQMPKLKLVASYAFVQRKNLATEFQLGEGIVGEAALEQQMIIVTQVPEDYIHIQSSLGETVPHNLVVIPFLYEETLKGVIELGFIKTVTSIQRDFLQQAVINIGIAVNTAQSRTKMQELLHQTQTQTEELQTQTEELQSQAEELQTQQEELRQSNEELEERSRELERQKEEIQEKNQSLEKSQQLIETKAKEVAQASKYKSEFLANMSHELRTPLNSLLILAQLFAENKPANLTDKQVEYAQTIHSAGSDLLTLINDILDLSKVEAGKMEVHVEPVSLTELVQMTQQKFLPLAQNKGLNFQSRIEDTVPERFSTDGQRLKQIINNLLSNAFKFTTEGEIQLVIKPVTPDELAFNPQVAALNPVIAFWVSDTGIGIPKEKQAAIFEAFQQVDGTTSRRYGGTGLGLSISRQFARLLGGDLQLQSEAGQGSTFILYLPEQSKSKKTPSETQSSPQFTQDRQPTIASKPLSSPSSSLPPLTDDREQLQATDKSLLIVEDDRKFSTIINDLAHEKGFKCLIAEDGKMGLQLAEQYQPNAIVLDVNLPQVDGWTVMEKLKDNPNTRHIPVHFMSAADQGLEAKKMGAIGYLHKPVNMAELGDAFKKIEHFIDQSLKNLLVITDDKSHQRDIFDLVSNEDIQLTLAINQNKAFEQLHGTLFDCIILDIDVEQKIGLQFLKQLQQQEELTQIPIIIYAARELTRSEEVLLQEYADNLTIKAVRSPERLLDEATLFLHQIESHLSTEKRQMLQMIHNKEAILKNKRVLLVDDDVRNTFALMTFLESKEMEVTVGNTGKEALTLLEEQPNIDIILMDIMMPEMDGYEAMQQIRKQERFRKLPMIALTAKAMKGDKGKCIEAGANDYLSKPIDTDKLLSLIRVWLYR